MHFYKPSQFWLLAILIIVALMLFWARMRKNERISRFAHLATYRRLVPGYNFSLFRIQKAIYYSIIIFCTIALAQPQWGKEKTTLSNKGIDVLFLLDTSKSMDAIDVRPSRISKAKNSIKLMLKEIRGHRVGLIAFAAQSYLTCPLTHDYATFRLFLDAIDTDYIPIQGTSLYNCLQAAITAFGDTEKKYSVVILFSDGEDHLGGLPDILSKFRSLGIRVFCVGVGTADGSPIPISRDDSSYLVDDGGDMIITRLEDTWLVQIAQETGGSYYPVTESNNEIKLILEQIDSLEKKEFKDVLVIQKQDRFQLFLIFIYIFLIADLLLSEKKRI